MINLSKPNPIPENAMERLSELIASGNLYRYSTDLPELSDVTLLEKDVCKYIGAKYALAVNSCATGLYLSLLSYGVKPTEKILLSGFTYTAVPSVIVHLGATPILVDCGCDFCVDIDDLKAKITTDIRIFILSHMRGHISNMDEIVKICTENNIILFEDCAHTIGSRYKDKHLGTFGIAASFSLQSHKLLNAGEGGILITNDEEIISKSILYSGSQERFWQKHDINNKYLEEYIQYIPNYSVRMSNLTASIARSQIPHINDWVKSYRKKYEIIESLLLKSEYIFIPPENKDIYRVKDTIQFTLINFTDSELSKFQSNLKNSGLSLKTFGYEGNPRYYKSWKYIKNIESVNLPNIDKFLKSTFDVRLPLWLTNEEISNIGHLITDNIKDIKM